MRSNSDFMTWLDRQLDQDPSLAKRVHERLQEAWLYRNRSALASVRRGIEEAGSGKARTIGSFAKHAHDKTA